MREHTVIKKVRDVLATIDPLGAVVRGEPLLAAPPVYTDRCLDEAADTLHAAVEEVVRARAATADQDTRTLLAEAQRSGLRVLDWIGQMRHGHPHGLLTLVIAMGVALQTRDMPAALRRELVRTVGESVELRDGPAPRDSRLAMSLVADLREMASNGDDTSADLLRIAGTLRNLTARATGEPARAPGALRPWSEPTDWPKYVEPLRSHCERLATFLERAHRCGHGLSECEGTLEWLPGEPGANDARLTGATGKWQRIAWITAEIDRHHLSHAVGAPQPTILVDPPILRLLSMNAAFYPLPEGEGIICINTKTFSATSPMSLRARAFLSMIAAHEAVPGHALHHWLGHVGINGQFNGLLHNERSTEGWAMYVERMVTAGAPGRYEVVWAYHALRRLLPTTVRAIRETNSDSVGNWVSTLLTRCPSLVAEISDPSKFGIPRSDYYAIGYLQFERALGQRRMDEAARSILSRGRVPLGERAENRPAASDG